MSPPRKRADVLLVERGLFESRARAQAAIEARLVTANDKQVLKASEGLPEDAVLQAQWSCGGLVCQPEELHCALCSEGRSGGRVPREAFGGEYREVLHSLYKAGAYRLRIAILFAGGAVHPP